MQQDLQFRRGVAKTKFIFLPTLFVKPCTHSSLVLNTVKSFASKINAHKIFSIKNLFDKCDRLRKSSMKNFDFLTL